MTRTAADPKQIDAYDCAMNDEQLMAEMLRALEIDHQYIRHFRADQAAEIALVRSLGRKAARTLGAPTHDRGPAG